MSAGDASRPPSTLWVAAIYEVEEGGRPVGSGVVIDADRVLTCAHVIDQRPDVWIAFPMAFDLVEGRRIRAPWRTVPPPALQDVKDVAVLRLESPVPDELVAPLRNPRGHDLVDTHWWAFGFPKADPLGNAADGIVGEGLGEGWIRLDRASRYAVEAGFSGAPVWSPLYNAVVAIIGRAHAEMGDAHALTVRGADIHLPTEKLGSLCAWTVQSADVDALAAWGWSLETDPEARRHWRPRSRGVSTEAEQGFRFRGRTAALTKIIEWMTAPRRSDRRALVVTGMPGTGKSAVLGRVVTTADARISAALPRDDSAVRAPIGSVACAVHAKGKTATEVAKEIAKAASAALPSEARELAGELRAALDSDGRDGAQRQFAVVIDALDEAASPKEARAIVREVVQPLAEYCSDIGVRVVVGSRRLDDDGDLLAAFRQSATILDLDDPGYFAFEDLVAYTMATLQLRGSERPHSPYAADDVARPVAWRIAMLAGQNFLIAGLQARRHGMYDDCAIAPARIAFDATVEEALHQYLEVLQPLDGIPATYLLTALAFAEAPGLTLALWSAAIKAVMGREVPEHRLKAFVQRSAANFLVESSGEGDSDQSFRLFHQALNETLLAQRDTARDEAALSGSFIAIGRGLGWDRAPSYLLRALPGHAQRGAAIDVLLDEDEYPLYADLRRLIPAALDAAGPKARHRARLLRKTLRAVDAPPDRRIALLSVVEAQEHLGTTYQSLALPAPYRAVWSTTGRLGEEAVLEGHVGPVRALAVVSVGGRELLASAGDDGGIRLWDPVDGTVVRVLADARTAILALAVVPGAAGDLLASAGEDAVIRLWDPSDGGLVRTLVDGSAAIVALTALPVNGRTMVAGADASGTIRIWDPGSGAVERVLAGHAEPIRALTAVPVGDRVLVASGDADGVIIVWDPVTGAKERTVKDGSGAIGALTTVVYEGRVVVASGEGSGNLRLWDPISGQPRRTFDKHGGAIVALVDVNVGNLHVLAVAGTRNTITLLNLAARHNEQGVVWSASPVINALTTVSAGGRTMFASAGEDSTIRLWNVFEAVKGQAGKYSGRETKGLALVSIDGKACLAVREPDSVILDPETSKHENVLEASGRIRALTAVPVRGRTLLAGAGDNDKIWLWDPAGGRFDYAAGGSGGPVEALAAVPVADRVLLAGAGGEKRIRLWDPAGSEPPVMIGDERPVHALASIPVGGGALLACGSDSEIVLWDPVDDRLVRTLQAGTGPVRSIVALPTAGRTFIVGAASLAVGLWDAVDGTLHRILDSFDGKINALAAVPLGTRTLLAGGGTDASVRLWDPESGRVELEIPLRLPVNALAVNGAVLFAGLADGVTAIRLDLEAPA